MYGHGDGSHSVHKWFNAVKKFRFKTFPNLDKDELKKVERLMIYANNHFHHIKNIYHFFYL